MLRCMLYSFACCYVMSPVLSCLVCQNGGTCSDDKCTCPDSFYGVVCQQYSSSYIVFVNESADVNKLQIELESEFDDGGLSYQLQNEVSTRTLRYLFKVDNLVIRQILDKIADTKKAVLSIEDFDECRQGATLCNNGKKCVNTYGSFKCECGNGYTEEDGKCNSKWVTKETQIWLGLVGAVVVLLIIMLIVIYNKRYRRRKRMKKKANLERKTIKRNNTVSTGRSSRPGTTYTPSNSQSIQTSRSNNKSYSNYANIYSKNRGRTKRNDFRSTWYNVGPYGNNEEYDSEKMAFYMRRGFSINESKKLVLLTSKYGTRDVDDLRPMKLRNSYDDPVLKRTDHMKRAASYPLDLHFLDTSISPYPLPNGYYRDSSLGYDNISSPSVYVQGRHYSEPDPYLGHDPIWHTSLHTNVRGGLDTFAMKTNQV